MLRCRSCGKEWNDQSWICSCGGCLDFIVPSSAPLFTEEKGIWRYLSLLPFQTVERVTLGESETPIVALEEGSNVLLKLEYCLPTGSFKDRGAAAVISLCRAWRVKQVIEDSSGNAGASMAAYAARAMLPCRIFIPASASGPKVRQIQAYGAEVEKVTGTREEVARRAQESAKEGYYAGHGRNPFFLWGVASMAMELFEQMGRIAPDLMIVPVGSGTLLLGLFLGFSRLRKHGLIQKLPELVGVQASGCAPLYSCWTDKVFERGETIAEGIRIAFPSRGEQILQAIRATEGKILEVTDAEIVSAWEKMKRRGFYIEPTSAVPIAALAKMNRDELGGKIVVIPLTGHGLKVTLPVTRSEIS